MAGVKSALEQGFVHVMVQPFPEARPLPRNPDSPVGASSRSAKACSRITSDPSFAGDQEISVWKWPNYTGSQMISNVDWLRQNLAGREPVGTYL
jgi:hypothetical protein